MELYPIATDGNEHIISVVTVPFCRMRFLNDTGYFKGRTAPTLRRTRRNNVIAAPLDKHKYTNEYTSYEFLNMIENRSVGVGDELFMWYSDKYISN